MTMEPWTDSEFRDNGTVVGGSVRPRHESRPPRPGCKSDASYPNLKVGVTDPDPVRDSGKSTGFLGFGLS